LRSHYAIGFTICWREKKYHLIGLLADYSGEEKKEDKKVEEEGDYDYVDDGTPNFSRIQSVKLSWFWLESNNDDAVKKGLQKNKKEVTPKDEDYDYGE